MTDREIKKLIKKHSSRISTDEGKALIELVTNKPDGSDDNSWAQLILEASDVIQKHLGDKKAIELLSNAYYEYKKYYPSSFHNKVKILKDNCYLQLAGKNIKDAHDLMNKYLYNALCQIKFSQKLQDMRYYSFRGISDYSINEIKEQKISLAHPREFNDPLDTILVWWLDKEIKNAEKSEQEMNFRLLMKKASEHIKLRCLIGSKFLVDDDWEERKVEDLSVLMWAHYAKSHTGMCIEYEFDDDFFKIGSSSDEEELVMIAPIKYSDKIDLSTTEPSMKDALFTKSHFWKYENEMRLCWYSVKEDKDFPEIECKGAIKAIYLGVKCNDTNRRKVEQAIGDKDIPLYKMEVDENLLTQFKKVQIG